MDFMVIVPSSISIILMPTLWGPTYQGILEIFRITKPNSTETDNRSTRDVNEWFLFYHFLLRLFFVQIIHALIDMFSGLFMSFALFSPLRHSIIYSILIEPGPAAVPLQQDSNAVDFWLNYRYDISKRKKCLYYGFLALAGTL